jgi:hypothetical protein
MTQKQLEAIKEIIPQFDDLPTLLLPREAAPLIRWSLDGLNNDRYGRRRVPFTMAGGKVLYPKVKLALWLLKNSTNSK